MSSTKVKKVYQNIWQPAKPYYQRGRPMDIDHIEWFMQTASYVCQKEHLDDSLLLPLAILHDVGYSQVTDVKTANYYNKDIRKAHMEAGKDIAIKLLKEVGYPEDKITKIAYYISVHDNWAYGEVDLYLKDPILGTFKDLDYLWIFTSKGFAAIKKVLNKTNKEMLKHLHSESSPIGNKKPFTNKTTKNLHDKYLKERERNRWYYNVITIRQLAENQSR